MNSFEFGFSGPTPEVTPDAEAEEKKKEKEEEPESPENEDNNLEAVNDKENIMQLISKETLQDIETSLGLDFLDQKERTEMMTKITALISNRAGIRIMKGFSEEEAQEFNKIPEENFAEMEKYILSKNPNAPAIFEEEAQRTKEELLNVKL